MGQERAPEFFSLSPFDSARFVALTEGLEVSIVALAAVKDAADTHRLDSDYFRRAYLADQARVTEYPERFEPIGGLPASLDASAFYPSIEAEYGSGDLPFLRVGDITGFIELGSATTIPADLCARYPTLNRVRDGDLLFTKGGAIDRVGLVTFDAAVSRDLISLGSSALEREEQNFLFAYFQTAFFKRALVRSASQTAQPHLTLGLVRRLPVMRVSSDFRAEVSKLVSASQSAAFSAKAYMAQAETDLLHALGLDDWSPPEPLSYIRSASVVMAAGRLDAQYYAPKHDDVLARLDATGHAVRISDEEGSFVSRGTQPDYCEEGLPVINSRHVRTNRVILDGSNRLALAGRLRIRPGDVLVNGTGVGTIGRSAPYMFEAEAMPDNHVTIVRLQEIDPVYLSVFLNSPLGQSQLERMTSGSSGQVELYPEDIRQLTIWKAPGKLQARIRHGVDDAFNLAAKSNALLTAAKRAVEVAIDQDETAALASIAEQEAQDAAAT